MDWDKYEVDGQMTFFDKPAFKINKPIRLIELFAGIGSQAMALRDLGADFETYRVIEFDKFAIASYNAIHGTNFEPTDITQVGGVRTRYHGERQVLLHHDLLFPLPGSFRCRKAKGNGERKRNTKRTSLGSGKTVKRDRIFTAGLTDGERTAGAWP